MLILVILTAALIVEDFIIKTVDLWLEGKSSAEIQSFLVEANSISTNKTCVGILGMGGPSTVYVKPLWIKTDDLLPFYYVIKLVESPAKYVNVDLFLTYILDTLTNNHKYNGVPINRYQFSFYAGRRVVKS